MHLEHGKTNHVPLVTIKSASSVLCCAVLYTCLLLQFAPSYSDYVLYSDGGPADNVKRKKFRGQKGGGGETLMRVVENGAATTGLAKDLSTACGAQAPGVPCS
jgi:hypothetical protein